MSTLSSIIVFGKDETLLNLLHGYCFSKQITVNNLDFTISEIREISKIKPDLIMVPINLYQSPKRSFEVSALRREINKYFHFKVCALIDSHTSIPLEISGLFDFVIHNPIDLNELDGILKRAFPDCRDLGERRFGERRSQFDRRNAHSDHNPGFPGQKSPYIFEKTPKAIEFHLDARNRCLLLNANKVELTPKEYGLIELLMTDVDRIFLTDEIIKHLWPENGRATKSDLYQYMHMLRKKIEDDPNNPKWVTNVKGYGYKLNLN